MDFKLDFKTTGKGKGIRAGGYDEGSVGQWGKNASMTLNSKRLCVISKAFKNKW